MGHPKQANIVAEGARVAFVAIGAVYSHAQRRLGWRA
jgi:hypothetical protein